MRVRSVATLAAVGVLCLGMAACGGSGTHPTGGTSKAASGRVANTFIKAAVSRRDLGVWLPNNVGPKILAKYEERLRRTAQQANWDAFGKLAGQFIVAGLEGIPVFSTFAATAPTIDLLGKLPKQSRPVAASVIVQWLQQLVATHGLPASAVASLETAWQDKFGLGIVGPLNTSPGSSAGTSATTTTSTAAPTHAAVCSEESTDFQVYAKALASAHLKSPPAVFRAVATAAVKVQKDLESLLGSTPGHDSKTRNIALSVRIMRQAAQTYDDYAEGHFTGVPDYGAAPDTAIAIVPTPVKAVCP